MNELLLIFAGIVAAIATRELVACLFFWERWGKRDDKLEFLRERFGRDRLSDLANERAVWQHRRRRAVFWSIVCPLAWAWVIDLLRGAL